VDEKLVKNIALAGGGKSCIVRNTSNIREAVMKQLESALQPGMTDVHVSWKNAETDSPESGIKQTPANPPPIFRGTRLVSFAALPSSCPPCKVILTGSFGDSDYRSEVTVNPATDKIPDNQIIKLGALSLIKDIESGNSSGDSCELSIKYGVLCKKTVFFGMCSSGEVIKTSMVSRKVSRSSPSSSSYGYSLAQAIHSQSAMADVGDGMGMIQKLSQAMSVRRCAIPDDDDDDDDDNWSDDVLEEEGDGDDMLAADECYACVEEEEEEEDVMLAADCFACPEEEEKKVNPKYSQKVRTEITLDSIVDLLNADGSFPEDSLVSCGLDSKAVRDALPDSSGCKCDVSLLNSIWVTFVVIEFIRKRFAEKEAEWKLIIAKSEKYARKHLGDDTLFNAWKESAKSFVAKC